MTIKELAELIQSTVRHQGEIVWDTSKPDGTPRKLMDITKLNSLGWQAEIPLEEGVLSVYKSGVLLIKTIIKRSTAPVVYKATGMLIFSLMASILSKCCLEDLGVIHTSIKSVLLLSTFSIFDLIYCCLNRLT